MRMPTARSELPTPDSWKTPSGRPRITWMMAVLDDLKPHKLTPTQAVSMAQNQPFLTLRLLSGAIHSCSHARNDAISLYQQHYT